MNEQRNAGSVPLLGGRLCLDFANTVDWRLGEQPLDLLSSYEDLIAWSLNAGILSRAEARGLVGEARKTPAPALAVFRRAIALRELIYRIFSRIACGGTPADSDVDDLNAALPRSLSHLCLVRTRNAFEWGWAQDGSALDGPLWHIVLSAAVLLVEGRLNRVSQCNDDCCGWLFYDSSKNGSRRWCSMADCGNRAKARRHYSKSRAAGKARSG